MIGKEIVLDDRLDQLTADPQIDKLRPYDGDRGMAPIKRMGDGQLRHDLVCRDDLQDIQMFNRCAYLGCPRAIFSFVFSAAGNVRALVRIRNNVFPCAAFPLLLNKAANQWEQKGCGGGNEAAERTIDCSAYRTCIGMIVKSSLGKFLCIFCHELFRSRVSESVKGNGTLPSQPESRSERQQEFLEPAGY